jgi:hypothetical protein
MSKTHLILASLFLMMVASNAWGGSSLFGPSDRTECWDFSIQTRYVGSSDFEGEHGARLSIEDDLGWGFDLGYNINERFKLGGFVSWRSVSYSARIVDAADADNTSNYGGWLDTANLALNATWNVLANRFTPYVQGSIGWAMLDTNVPADIDYGCYWDPWWGYICTGASYPVYSTTQFVYNLGLGFRWDAPSNFFIKVGIDANWMEYPEAENFTRLGSVSVAFGVNY